MVQFKFDVSNSLKLSYSIKSLVNVDEIKSFILVKHMAFILLQAEFPVSVLKKENKRKGPGNNMACVAVWLKGNGVF